MKNLQWIFPAALLALLAGCLDPESSANPAAVTASGKKIFTIATDYKTFSLDVVAEGKSTSLRSFDALHWGVSLSTDGSSLYAANQADGSLTAIDAAGSSRFAVSVGKDANPYQVLRKDDTLYVLRWAYRSILMLKASNGDSIGSIDLSSMISADGNVNAAHGVIQGSTLFVALQRTLSGYAFDTGKVAVIDLGLRKLVKGIPLLHHNPARLVVNGSKLYAVCHGGYGSDKDGGIDAIDMASLGASTKVFDAESTARPKDLAIGGGKAWVALDKGYSNGVANSTVASIDLATGSVGADLGGLSSVESIVWDGTALLVADRATGDKHSIATLDVSGSIVSRVKTSLPPTSLVIVP